jgi:hypothetical protein
MAIAFPFESAGFTKEQYDRALEVPGRGDINNLTNPTGFLGHIAGPTETGWQVVDIWESEQAAQAFYGSAPFQTMLAGLPPLDRRAWPLHRLELDGPIRQRD